jgi:hypothetical protein
MLKKHVKCTKKNICCFVMAEWDRLVLCSSNNLPLRVYAKSIDGSFDLCFCCEDSPSMEVINFPCCKASVHRHCVLEALQSNDQCVYCQKVLDPQDVINCTTLSQLKAPSGEANVSQTTTLPDLKAPPEANMSQNEFSKNINSQNILGEPPVQDEDKNIWEEPVQDKESSLSSISTFTKNYNNGQLFAPTCITCFDENKYISMSEKKCAHPWKNVCLNSTGEYIVFPLGMMHCRYYNDNYNRNFTTVQ